MISGQQHRVGLVAAGLAVVAIVAAVLAYGAWDGSRPEQYVTLAVLAIVSAAIALVLALPGGWHVRLVGAGTAAVLVTAVLAWTTVVGPQRDASATYEGDGVRWSRHVPEDWRAGDGRDDVSRVTLLSDERAVITRGKRVLVIDPRDGRTVRAFTSTASTAYGMAVARTVDGFVIQDGSRFAFHDADGQLVNIVQGQELVARLPGLTVVLDCPTGACVARAVSDDGEERWRSRGHGRSSTIRIADELPAPSTDEFAVVPADIVLERERTSGRADQPTFDVLDAEDGRAARTFTATHAGSSLSLEGRSVVFGARADGAGGCALVVWAGEDESQAEVGSCELSGGVIGDQLLLDEAASRVVDLTTPKASSRSADRVRGEAGRDGSAGAGGAVTVRDRVVTGGAWDVAGPSRWRHESPRKVTSATVGPASVLVTSHVAALNPWDRPGKGDREFTVLDLADGHRTGHVRINARGGWDHSAGLPDGSFLVAVRGGRLLRVGPR